ncbi:LlaJI family restriction endonuclease [Thalassobium sp. R2A62]|uniref:LlaJI family restriction endonuclease n=1 Tax=Thalassobium sp. R2A62 TaxID=633131 RepID=UPI0001B1D218|nr:LlaJI family restriction endonuclease [Thalassobium sp. R2A62]EET46268.1 hypothetical protein TR2A62_2256 [Thalassobium sp. R2A62]
MTDPVIHLDRMAVRSLGSKDAPLLDAMNEWGIGKVESKETIHFCGLVRDKVGRTAIFLPRSMQVHSMSAARLTMKVLARYGQSAANRRFATDGEHGNPGTLAVIQRLAADFQNHGLFVERQRVRCRNSGKPDWKRTVTRERAFVSDGGDEVFPDIATTRSIDSSENLLAQVQAAVMGEIIEQHGWWLEGASARRSELRWQKKPHQPRALWALLLDGLLPQLYSSRSVFLAEYLGHYLRECRASASGSFVFGIEDFHIVWEQMLAETLEGVEPHWNEKLPRAVYETLDGRASDAPERRMLTDIVLRTPTGFTIIDAKYYAANSPNTVPGWPDIAKQMFYEMALRSVVGDEPEIRNCFVFPAPQVGATRFERVQMREVTEGGSVTTFPVVECHYLSMDEVISAYVEHRGNLAVP